MTVDGLFDIGSVHKLFKWILLEKLYEDDLFEYSDPINNYVASPVISSGTINHLTNHSTGMTDIGDNLYADVFSRYGSGDLPYVYTYADMMAFLVDVDTGGFTNGFKDGFTLGVDYNYSSYGPLIAGEIAEELTGTDAIAQIESKIINQLDLKNTTFVGFDEDPSDRVQGYGDTGTVNAAYEFPPLHHDLLLGVSSASEGALFSTGCDMVNFAKNISDPAMNFLEEATINSRIATPIEVFAGALNVGRGVMNYEGFAGGNFWVHGGNGMHSHSSVVGYNPDNGVSAAVLANLNPAYITNNYQFHLEVLDILNTYFAD
jgi:CubicO group peptidase (beta-lactamase class C family)